MYVDFPATPTLYSLFLIPASFYLSLTSPPNVHCHPLLTLLRQGLLLSLKLTALVNLVTCELCPITNAMV